MYAARCRKWTGFSSDRNTLPGTAPGPAAPGTSESTSLIARLLHGHHRRCTAARTGAAVREAPGHGSTPDIAERWRDLSRRIRLQWKKRAPIGYQILRRSRTLSGTGARAGAGKRKR